MSTAPTPNSRLDALAADAQPLRAETQRLLDLLTDSTWLRNETHSQIEKTWVALLLAMARELEVSSEFFVECSINAINEAKAVRGSHAELERRLAALEAQETNVDTPNDSLLEAKRRLAAISGAPAKADLLAIVHCVETRMKHWQQFCTNLPVWAHEPLADNEVFLGSWVDSDDRRHVDLYFRPKPDDTANGFCDAIIARFGAYKNDVRVGPADVFSLAELGVHGDDVQRAMRVGHLMLVDRGLIPPPMVASHIFGKKFQVQFCTGANPDGEEGWVPALVDARASTFHSHDDADELRTLLKSRGVDETRLRIEFIYKLDDRIG